MLKSRLSLGVVFLTVFATAITGCHVRTDEDVAAERTFRESFGKMSATVFPARIRDGKSGRHHDSAAAEIAAFLNSAKIAKAEASAAHVPLSAAAGYSQTKIYAASIQEFRAWLRDNPVSTDYAILPEYLIDGSDRPIGIHAYVLHRDGAEAFGIILNSHHASFKTIKPRNADEATRVLINGLRAELNISEEQK